MKRSTYFIRCHRGWRNVFLPIIEPSRYANLLSQSLGGIGHEMIKKPVVIVALGNERLGELDISAGELARKRAAHPELIVIEACLDGVHIVLIGYGK